MSSNDYVAYLEKQQPKLFKAKKIQLSPDELRRILKRAFEQGEHNGKTSKSLFEQIFG